MNQQVQTKVAEAQFLKYDDSLGLVFGWAIVCSEKGQEYYDLGGDHIPEDVMLEAAAEFMQKSRVALAMHGGEPVGEYVFAWPMTSELAKAYGITTDRTGLMVAMKPTDDAIRAKFRSGEYTGFSIGYLLFPGDYDEETL